MEACRYRFYPRIPLGRADRSRLVRVRGDGGLYEADQIDTVSFTHFLYVCLFWVVWIVCADAIYTVRSQQGESSRVQRQQERHKKSLALRTVFQIGEFHIYVHWSVLVVVVCFPIGLVYAYELDRSVFSILNICTTFALLVLVHELGHVLTSRLVGAKVHGIYVSCMSGRCYTDGTNSRLKNVLIYAGGPLANLCILMITLVVFTDEHYPYVRQTFWIALVTSNVFMIISCLIPKKWDDHATDGYHILHNLTEHWVPIPLTTQSEHQFR